MATAWLRHGSEVGGDEPRLQVGLRVLRAGVDHLAGDTTALLRLPWEERSLAQGLLPAVQR